ncbi:phytoene/squalene synthase family protein [Terrihabitans sp. B22-R8]|uniref:phytoene/squalene synthase family protein n=1 Tax=Terrihabitans sp. B22-R8 TaxID=3425128 RepID=UPI00403D4392
MDQTAFCQSLVRESDPDRFFATLFAPEAKRPALFALYAFNAEVSRVRDVISEPVPGEIRLTWWREVIEGAREVEAASHPVANSLLAAIGTYRLPREALVRLIEARVFDVYNDPMPTIVDLEGYAGDTSSALFQLASIILADGQDSGAADAAGHAGVAYSIVGLLRSLPLHASRQQLFLPADVMARHGVDRNLIFARKTDDSIRAAFSEMCALAHNHLQSAKEALSDVAKPVLPAYLPGSLIELYARQMERAGYDPLKGISEVSQWRKQIRLWQSARTGQPLG